MNFKDFLDKNQLKVSALPKLIQNKIEYHSELHDLIEYTESEIHQEIKEELERLDYEILMDIQEEYQDRLQNNERLEKLARSPTLKKSIKKKAITRLRSDQSILEELVKMGRTKNIGRSVLKEMGIKAKIGRNTIIGNYLLKKVSLVRYSYDIIPLDK